MNVKLPEPATDEQHSLLLHLALLWISQVHVHRGCGMSLLSVHNEGGTTLYLVILLYERSLLM
jgi:hypothetical protein